MKYYLNLDFKTGRLYDYSKESQEGYDAHKNTAGNTSYRKYFFKGVYGTLKSIYVKDSTRGLQLKMVLTQGEDYYYMLAFSLFDQKGNLDKYVESIISLIPNIEVGKDYRIFPFVTEQESDGRKYSFKGVSIKEAVLDGNGGGEVGEKVESALSYQKKEDAKLEENMIPRLEYKEVIHGSGKFMPTSESVGARKDFLLGVLDSNISRLNPEPEDQTSSEPQAVIKPAEKVATTVIEATLIEDEDFDDVPF